MRKLQLRRATVLAQECVRLLIAIVGTQLEVIIHTTSVEDGAHECLVRRLDNGQALRVLAAVHAALLTHHDAERARCTISRDLDDA